MKKKLFQAGNYTQGNISVKDISDSIKKTVKDVPVILGHVGDYIKNKIPRTAIPTAGTVKNFSLEGDFLAGEISLNEFGNTIVGNGGYSNMSIAFKANGEIDHLALLGYAEPACKYIDKLSQRDIAFSDEEEIITEYAIQINIEEGKILTLEELMKAIDDSTELTTKDKKELIEHIAKKSEFGIDEKTSIIEDMMGSITDEEKSKMRIALGWGSYTKMETREEKLKVFGELKAEFSEKPKQKTEDEIRAELKAEFAEETRKTTEYAELEKEIESKVFPAYQGIAKKYAKVAVEKNETVEFAAEDGTTSQAREVDKLKEELSKMPKFDTKEFSVVTKKAEKGSIEEVGEIAKEVKARYKI